MFSISKILRQTPVLEAASRHMSTVHDQASAILAKKNALTKIKKLQEQLDKEIQLLNDTAYDFRCRYQPGRR